MRRAVIIATVAVLVGLIIKIVVAPSKTVAGTETTSSSIQTAMPIYDLHIGHPNMKNLPVQEAPRP
jgi:hypothetical protein